MNVDSLLRLQPDRSRAFAVIKRTLVALASVSCTTAASQIPIELQGNRPPILTATVDGMPVRLRFDLGDGTALVLQKAVLEKIHAKPTGKTARMQGVDGPFEAPLFNVARVEIGGTLFRDAIVRRDEARKGYAPDSGTDGFLGTGLLKTFQIVIDYPDRTMTLVQNAQTDPAGPCTGTQIPFSDNPKWRGEPVTEADTDIGRVTLWWDTGAPVSILRKEIMSPTHGGETLASAQFRLGERNFGPWQFQRWGEMNLPGFDGFIGSDFFAKHVVCVDFPRSRVVVKHGAR